MAGDQQKLHAIMVPYPLQGHVIPAVHLAVKLAAKGFAVTFVNTHSVHHYYISKSLPSNAGGDIFAGARESGLDIRYATVSDGLPVGFDRSLNHGQFMESLLHVFSAHVDELVGGIVRKSEPPVTCLIADTFYVWPSMIAEKYGLVNVSFWTEPALVLNLYYHLHLLRENGHFGCSDKREDTIDYIPGVPSIKPTDLMSYLQAVDVSTVEHRIINRAFDDVKRADIILCNTVRELELESISALHQNQPMYAIGPIFPNGFTKSLVATSLWPESNCAHWLDARPNGSVLYVSFGSYAHVTKTDIVEIAHGLLLSGVGFVWVLRPDIVSSDEADVLPVGFQEHVKDQGMMVPWCNQIDVISHQAVGGFLTHCGWNSILESMWCAVPLLCFPLLTDQFTNRKLVVDDWKVGLNLCDQGAVTREEVADKISCLMNGTTSEELRRETEKMKSILEDALAVDGSSQTNFNQFVKKMNKKINLLSNHV
ncbi:UDP-glycosyltransferase 86A1 [Diospyros lotus]|uniref:UDP-glycosyltransferase 86A1 n=1 Tax=Diospyros lotus TaxID=55363 RepID=UPI002256245D|nr:UDP-glycosyltransferase 86A1 [Diospyros lotus]